MLYMEQGTEARLLVLVTTCQTSIGRSLETRATREADVGSTSFQVAPLGR